MNENAGQITTVKNCKAGVSIRLARHQKKIESFYRTEFRLLSTCLKHDFRVSLPIDTAPQYPWKLNLIFFSPDSLYLVLNQAYTSRCTK